MRLDRFLSERNVASRKELKSYLKQGLCRVNGQVVLDGSYHIVESKDEVVFRGITIQQSKFRYYMLHKASGCVTATVDNVNKTIFDGITLEHKEELFPIGRLDKDTEGLLILTNDGGLAHDLLSPNKHIPKTYLVKLKYPIHQEQIEQLKQGVDIKEKHRTKPADVVSLHEKEILLTIYEGKFHQVKRMLLAVSNEVTYLKRMQMGELRLDDTLERGSVRTLTELEIKQLKNK